MCKKKFTTSMLLVFFTLSMFFMMPLEEAKANPRQLKDLPLGTVIYDSTAVWEHRTSDGYTGSGESKAVEWIVVAKNHPDYPTNSVTLISNEIIALYVFDNSTNRGGYKQGSNHWGNSGTPNATTGVRPWLNENFYNHFSSNFKKSILTTTLVNKDFNGNSYNTVDKIFLPSITEMGATVTEHEWTHSIGSNWAFINDNNSRRSELGGRNLWSYWTRSPYSGDPNQVYNVDKSGSFSHFNADGASLGVRPVLNIKSDIFVKLNGELIWGDIVPSTPNNTITVKLDGKQLSFDVAPIIQDGRTLVPLRTIFEALGADIEWNEANKMVIATKGATKIRLSIGKNTADKNGMPIKLDVPAIISEGRTLVPLRFVSESLGAEVEWDGETKTISIFSFDD